MKDMLRKTMLTGLGLAVMTKDRIEDLTNELIKKGEMSEHEGQEFMDEMMRRSEQAQKDLETRLEKSITEVVEKLNLATKQDIAELSAKLDALATMQGSK